MQGCFRCKEIYFEKKRNKKKFVLQAGRVEPGKNQAMLCWALRNTEIKVVLIGGTKHWPSYADLCRKSMETNGIIDTYHKICCVCICRSGGALSDKLMDTWDYEFRGSLNCTPVVGSTLDMN